MLLRRGLLGIALLLLTACATANFQTSTKFTSIPNISGRQVFIYSFLDLRNADFGDQMVREVNSQLQAQLSARDVQTDLVTYGESGKAGGRWSPNGSVEVPVAAIVTENLAREEVLGADYRLLILPSNITIYGANQDYRVVWELLDVSTGEIVWSTSLNGNRTVWYSQNEDAEGRADAFVSGVIAEMESSGLFSAAPALQAQLLSPASP